MAPGKWVGNHREFLVYILAMALLLAPAFFYQRQQQDETRDFAVQVCRSVNANGKNLTVEHRKTRSFLLLAYRIRLAAAKDAATPAERLLNFKAAKKYLDLATSYRRFDLIRCKVPE